MLMATRGKPTVTLTNEFTVLFAPVRAHSEKPDEFYQLVERLCPARTVSANYSRGAHARTGMATAMNIVPMLDAPPSDARCLISAITHEQGPGRGRGAHRRAVRRDPRSGAHSRRDR